MPLMKFAQPAPVSAFGSAKVSVFTKVFFLKELMTTVTMGMT